MKVFSVILSFCLIIAMFSCSPVMVKTDIHNQKDFAKYTTYSWVDDVGNTANLPMEQQTKNAIENVAKNTVLNYLGPSVSGDGK